MECMRALIENDRQVEGCFTTYSPALERTALKKDRYLAADAEPARPAPPAAPAPGESATQTSLFPNRSESPFADKLKQALHPTQD